MCRLRNLTDQKFGKLTAIASLGVWKSRGRWICECDCGNITTAITTELLHGHTQSCGCYRPQQKPFGEASRNEVLTTYRRHARERGLVWSISAVDWHQLTQQPCRYCGALPTTRNRAKGTSGEFIYNGLDRADNSRGYEIANIVPCCQICNRAKLVMSVDEFLSWARRVVQYNEVKDHGSN